MHGTGKVGDLEEIRSRVSAMHDQSGEMVYVTSNDVRVYVQLLPIENGSFFFAITPVD